VTTGTDTLNIAHTVEQIVKSVGDTPDRALALLQAIQSEFNYLPREALEHLCRITDISPARISGLATFYNQFRMLPAGKHLISVCHGTACHVAGAERVMDAIRRHLKISLNADTDDTRLFTVQKVSCLGCCSLAPVVRIDGRTYGRLTPMSAPQVIQRFLKTSSTRPARTRRFVPAQAAPAAELRIGLGSCCVASGSGAAFTALEDAVATLGVRAKVRCGACVGMCHRVPLVEFISPDGVRMRYGKVTPQAARAIVAAHLKPSTPLGRISSAVRSFFSRMVDDAAWVRPETLRISDDDPDACSFLGKQKHLVLEGCGELDPLDMDEYVRKGGGRALETALLEMTPDAVIDAVVSSGLRGRGGAGFPTGAKWRAVRNQPGETKYLVMNGDEGDPGAFMDRMLLESYPFRVIEGIIIAAYACGCRQGYLYIRAEYPLALQRMRQALRMCEKRGWLGDRILGTSCSLRLDIVEGAGAFVCGEETALLASIEGRRGTPRLRPPYPYERGLWGKPTNINNVETYAAVPWIIIHGPEAFASIGTPGSPGTKVFALAGRVRRGGLIEVPMGVTVRDIVEEIGGGVPEGHTFKAVQIGGPSGGCIPASLGNTPVDFLSLPATGAIMGSGGLVVLDDTCCMVDIAKYFLQFTQSESCGQCTSCRIGTKRMLEILERICDGKGTAQDLPLLESLGRQIQKSSLCGLGRTAPNPVLTTLRYFRDEYEAHIARRCPAKKCRALIRYLITDRCTGCTRCSQFCPAGAIAARPYEQHEIDPQKCIRCGTCRSVCPADAVEVASDG